VNDTNQGTPTVEIRVDDLRTLLIYIRECQAPHITYHADARQMMDEALTRCRHTARKAEHIILAYVPMEDWP